MDRFIGKTVYFSFGKISAGTDLNCYFKAPAAATAASANASAISAADSAIAALPAVGSLTVANEAALNDAKALTDALGQSRAFLQKTNADKLADLIEKMTDLKVAAAVAAVENAIDALPAPGSLNAGNYSGYYAAISAANAAYNALGGFQTMVNSAKSEKLAELVAKLGELDSDYATSLAAAQAWESSVTALGAPGDITLANYAAKKAAAGAARTAYGQLAPTVSAMVSPAKISELEAYEIRLNQVKSAVDAAALIEALPAAEDIALTDKSAVTAARAAYEALGSDRGLVSPVILAKLTEAETAIKELEIEINDWYVNSPIMTYTGNPRDGWHFSDTRDQGNNLFATTTKNYDLTECSVLWSKPTSGSGQWFYFGVTDEVTAPHLPGASATSGFGFILRPSSGNRLRVAAWNGIAEELINSSDPVSMEDGYYNNFNLDGIHTFSFVQQGEHWYLRIDSHIFNGKSFAMLDNYLNANIEATKVRIGGNAGFRAETVYIGSQAQSGDWWYSQTLGANTTGNLASGWQLIIPANAYAQYNEPLTGLDEKTVIINFNKNTLNSAPELAFVSDSDSGRDFAAGEGVRIRLWNRPESDPNSTHILAWVNEGWQTVLAMPANGADDVKVTVRQEGDGHWYLYLGETQIIFPVSKTEWNMALWMDGLIGEGKKAYLRVGSLGEEQTVSLKLILTAAEEPSDFESFLDLFDELRAAAAAGDDTALQLLANAWNGLSYITQLDVEGMFLDDDEAWDILQIIKNYRSEPSGGDEESGDGGGNENPPTGAGLFFAPFVAMLSAGGVLLAGKRRKKSVRGQRRNYD
jgi:hypothetical protein